MFFLVVLARKTTALESCKSVNGTRVVWDTRCSTGEISLGCNAAGQGENCRFCGSLHFLPCFIPGNKRKSIRIKRGKVCPSFIGGQRVVYDPRCITGEITAGCGAFDTLECRYCCRKFCDISAYLPCNYKTFNLDY